MPRLSPLKARDVIRKLRALGYLGPVAGGRHMHMYHIGRDHTIPIPMHGSKDIDVPMIRTIIREAGITVEEWLDL